MSKFSPLGSCQRQLLKNVELWHPAVIPRDFLEPTLDLPCGRRPLDSSIAAPSPDIRLI